MLNNIILSKLQHSPKGIYCYATSWERKQQYFAKSIVRPRSYLVHFVKTVILPKGYALLPKKY